MDKRSTESEKLEYLLRNGWELLDRKKENKETQKLVGAGFSSLIESKTCLSTEDAYRMQKIMENNSNKK